MYFVLDLVHMHTCISSLLGIYGNFRMKQKSVPSTSALGQRMNGNKSIWNKIWCWERRKVGHFRRQSPATWPNGGIRVRWEGIGVSQIEIDGPNNYHKAANRSTVEFVQDFLFKLGIKPKMHRLEISTFSLNNVIVRLTKIMNRADKNWAHF